MPLAHVDLDDHYVRALVLDAFASRSDAWTVSQAVEPSPALVADAEAPAEALFHWGEYERIDWERVASGTYAASSYCIRKGLIRKVQFAHNTKKWAAKHPEGKLARALPESWPLQLDDVDYIDEALCDVPEVRDMREGEEAWILKPSLTNQALAVTVFDRVADLYTALQAAPRLHEWVLQRYVANPLLVGGRKFHIRAYALCVGAMAAYVHDSPLALFAAAPYPQGADADYSNLDAHLTNTCRLRPRPSPEGSSSKDEDEDEDEDGDEGSGDDEEGACEENEHSGADNRDEGSGGGAIYAQPERRDVQQQQQAGPQCAAQEESRRVDESLVHLLSELPQLLTQQGWQLAEATQKVEQLQLDVREIIGECLEAVSGELDFFCLPNCFELFGFDLLVDEDWRPWLLEANAEPDFGQSGDRLRPVIAQLVEGTLKLTANKLTPSKAIQHSSTGEQQYNGWLPVFKRIITSRQAVFDLNGGHQP